VNYVVLQGFVCKVLAGCSTRASFFLIDFSLSLGFGANWQVTWGLWLRLAGVYMRGSVFFCEWAGYVRLVLHPC